MIFLNMVNITNPWNINKNDNKHYIDWSTSQPNKARTGTKKMLMDLKKLLGLSETTKYTVNIQNSTVLL